MSHEGSHQTTHSVGDDGLGGELAVAERVEHGGVGAEIAAPAHADGGEHGDGIAVDPSLGEEIGNKAQCGAHSAQGGDGEGNLVGVGEAEDHPEQAVELVGHIGQELHALVGGACVDTLLVGSEGENHDHGGDDEHAGDDGHAHIDTRLAAIEQGIESAQEGRLRAFNLLRVLLGHLLHHGILGGELRVLLHHEMLHHAGGDDTAAEGPHEAYKGLGVEALADHEDDDDETHAEGGAEIGERDILELLEMTGELLVLREGDDGGIVAQEGHHGTKRCHAGQIEERLHERLEEFFEQVDHAELHEEFAEGAGEHADAHEVEHGVEQQVVGRIHDGVEHVGNTHLHGDTAENGYDNEQAEHSGEHLSMRVFHNCRVVMLGWFFRSLQKYTFFL